MKLVQASQMIEERFQRLGNGKKLQEAVDDDVKDWQEAQAHVAKVDREILRLELHGRVDLVCKALEVQLLWVFLGEEKTSTSQRNARFNYRRCCLINTDALWGGWKTSCYTRYLVVVHVLVVPVALQPVLGCVLLDKIVDSVPEVVGLQQQQLDYEVTNLSLISLVATHGLDKEERRGSEKQFCSYSSVSLRMQASPHQTQDESVQSDDVVFPHHVIEYFDALVELLSAG